MKVMVVSANGKVGRLVVKEAMARGMDVTAVVRHADQSGAQHHLQRDLFDLTREDVKGFDVLVCAVGFFTPETVSLFGKAFMHLADLVEGTTTRLMIVGGAGALYVDDARTVRLVDTPDFPDAYKPLASNMAAGLAQLKARHGVDWTYVPPAAEFLTDGAKTGHYVAGDDRFSVNAQGVSQISYADYALGFVDEMEKGVYRGGKVMSLRW